MTTEGIVFIAFIYSEVSLQYFTSRKEETTLASAFSRRAENQEKGIAPSL